MDTLAQIARDAGAALVVDHTFATPLLARPLDLGAHFSVHSVTKYLAGHGDVLGGAVVTNAENVGPCALSAATWDRGSDRSNAISRCAALKLSRCAWSASAPMLPGSPAGWPRIHACSGSISPVTSRIPTPTRVRQ